MLLARTSTVIFILFVWEWSQTLQVIKVMVADSSKQKVTLIIRFFVLSRHHLVDMVRLRYAGDLYRLLPLLLIASASKGWSHIYRNSLAFALLGIASIVLLHCLSFCYAMQISLCAVCFIGVKGKWSCIFFHSINPVVDWMSLKKVLSVCGLMLCFLFVSTCHCKISISCVESAKSSGQYQ